MLLPHKVATLVVKSWLTFNRATQTYSNQAECSRSSQVQIGFTSVIEWC
jgi:hypothetical protein